MRLFSKISGRSKHSGAKADKLVLFDGKGSIYEFTPASVKHAVWHITAIYPVPEQRLSQQDTRRPLAKKGVRKNAKGN